MTSLVTLMLEVAKLEIQEFDLRDRMEVLEREERELMEAQSVSSSEVDSAIDEDDLLDEVEEFKARVRGLESVVHSGKAISRRFRPRAGSRSSSMTDLVQGIGEMDERQLTAHPPPSETPHDIHDRPYLILDVRSVEEFDREPILATSESYPASRLVRSINFESPSMLRYRNAPGKLVILVDYDETVSAKCATTLVQRGYENVFMLSGGLRVAGMKFPECLLRSAAQNATPNGFSFVEEEILRLEEILEELLSRQKSGRMSTCSSRISSANKFVSGSQSNLARSSMRGSSSMQNLSFNSRLSRKC